MIVVAVRWNGDCVDRSWLVQGWKFRRRPSVSSHCV